MTNDQIIVILLIVMAIVLTIQLAYIVHKKKRRKEEMSLLRKFSVPVESLADKAHNTILTTESISSTLARQGIDTHEANNLIEQAKKQLAMKDFSAAIERAEAAKLVLLRAKREAGSRPENIPLHSDPGKRPMDQSVFRPPENEYAPRKEKNMDSLPTNYVQSKFMLATTKDLLEKKNITRGEAYNFYSDAQRAYEREDYTKALSLAIKAERLLDSGTLTLIGEDKSITQSNEVIEILVCPGCEVEISDDDAFCRECGQNLESTSECPGCGNEIVPADKFCRKCGRKLK